jgi:prolipoprotein diacylglyceryltransferase
MFPYLDLFGLHLSMTATGIVLALLTFVITVYYLSKKNNQDFYKFFYQLPFWLFLTYFLGRYFAVVLEHSSLLPSAWGDFMTILRPDNFNLHIVGVLVAAVISLGTFFASIKRTENKKMWADILFSGICNATILLGLFFTLGDSFIGKPTDGIFAIRALQPESGLTKFDGVYPVGILLSLGALMVDSIINLLKIVLKKN